MGYELQFVDLSFFLLVFSTLFTLFLMYYVLKNKPMSQVQKILAYVLLCVLIICSGLIVQKFATVFLNADPVNFEGFVYIGTCFLPVMIFFMAQSFVHTKMNFTKKHLLLFIIPTINVLSLFTNNYFHLFYKHYSFVLNDMELGFCGYLHLLYTYGLFAISITKMLLHTVKTSGFFSRQSLFIIIGTLIPVVVNVLGAFDIIETNIYSTPISFAFSCFCYYIAILKFNFLNITPIALEKVVDRMSDSYVVLNEKNVIVDFNKPFLKVFNVADNQIRNRNIFNIDSKKSYPMLEKAIQAVNVSSKTFSYETHSENIDKYFNVEVSSIVDNNMFLGTLILFKDITQHEQDLKTIKDNQDMLIERERFASLGQMIGGIAHNLKTPIMSIAGASEALNDLISEYDISIRRS